MIEMVTEFLLRQINLSSGFWYPGFSDLVERLRQRRHRDFHFKNNGSGIACDECGRATFLRYMALLDIAPEELSGKRVLDAGCGPWAEFAAFCIAHGIADVYGCDINLSAEVMRRYPGKVYRADYHDTPDCIGFDYILCLASCDLNDGCESIESFLRILNPGGEIRIYPVHAAPIMSLGKSQNDAWLEMLGSLKVKLEFRVTEVTTELYPDICEVLIIRHSR